VKRYENCYEIIFHVGAHNLLRTSKRNRRKEVESDGSMMLRQASKSNFDLIWPCPQFDNKRTNERTDRCRTLCLRQSSLTSNVLYLAIRPSFRPSVCYQCEHDILKTNRFCCKLAQVVHGSNGWTTNFEFWGQKVKGQGYITQKLDLETWWRHHSVK